MILASFVLLGIISIRNLLTVGTLGHTWDWGIPYSVSGLNEMFKQGLSMWNPQFLGFPFQFSSNVTPCYLFLGFPNILGIDGTLVSKFLVVFSITVAGFFMYLFSRSIFAKLKVQSRFVLEAAALLSGYFYVANPYFFNIITSGANTQIVTYAFAPAVFFCFDKGIRAKSLRWIILSAFALTVISAAYNLLFFVVIMLPLYAVVFYGWSGLKASIKLGIAAIFTNLFWLIPFFKSTASISSMISETSPLSGILYNLQNQTSGIIQSILLAGYWRGGMANQNPILDPNFFMNSISSNLTWLWLLLSIGGLMIAVVPILFRWTKTYAFWMAIFGVTLVFDTGFHSPFPQIVSFVYEHFWFMSLFRDPQWLIWPASISLSILLGYGMIFVTSIQNVPLINRISRISKKVNIKNLTVVGISFLLIFSWTYPFLQGNLGGAVDNYNLPPGWEQAMQYVDSHSLQDQRLLFLPNAFSPLYLNTTFQRTDQGGNPDLYFAPRPTLTLDTASKADSDLAKLISSMFYQQNASKIAPTLSFLNFRFILLSTSYVPNFGEDARLWNYSNVYHSLSNAPNIKLISDNGYISLWENELCDKGFAYTSSYPVVEQSMPVLLSGAWSLFNGSVFGRSGQMLAINQSLNNFDFTAKISLIGNDSYDAGLIYGYNDSSNYYFAGIQGKSYLVTLAQYSQGNRNINQKLSNYSASLFIHISVRDKEVSTYFSNNGANWTPTGNYSIPNYNGGFVGLWAVDEAEFTEIRLTDSTGKLLTTVPAIDLSDIVSSSSFIQNNAVIFSPDSSELKSYLNTFSASQSSNSIINPVDYTQFNVEIENSSQQIIVLNENYDPNWRLYNGNVNWFQALFTTPSSSWTHVQVNGFANAWISTTNSTEHNYTLYYLPESYFLLGITISLTSAIVLLIYFSYPFLMRTIKNVSHRTRKNMLE